MRYRDRDPTTVVSTTKYGPRVSSPCPLKVFAAALILASKYLQDCPGSTRYWAEILDLEMRQVDQIQREFLRQIEYRLYVSTSQFANWRRLVRLGGIGAYPSSGPYWTRLAQALKLQIVDDADDTTHFLSGMSSWSSDRRLPSLGGPVGGNETQAASRHAHGHRPVPVHPTFTLVCINPVHLLRPFSRV
jgi:hypothetical protein